MPGPSDPKPTIGEYRAAVKALESAREVSTQKYEAAQAAGDIIAGQESLSMLKGALDAFKDVHARLTPTDLVVAEFKIETTGPNNVSLVIPPDVSRFDFLRRVSEAVEENEESMLVAQYLMTKWRQAPEFITPCVDYARIELTCFLGDIFGQSSAAQLIFLEDRGYEMASVADVAIGHVAHVLLAGRSMFGGYWNLGCSDGLLQLDGNGRCLVNHDTDCPHQMSPAIGSITLMSKDSSQ